jgi:hypothetical protein
VFEGLSQRRRLFSMSHSIQLSRYFPSELVEALNGRSSFVAYVVSPPAQLRHNYFFLAKVANRTNSTAYFDSAEDPHWSRPMFR